MLEEVIISDRHMSDGQMYSFLQLFFNTEKISLNWRLNNTVTDYVLLIKYEKKEHAAWLSIAFPFDVKFIFLTENTEG